MIQLTPSQILQETRDLAQGSITSRGSQVANALGITNQDLAQFGSDAEARFKFLMEKFKNFSDLLSDYEDTFEGRLQQLKERWQKASLEIFKDIAPMFKGLFENLIELTGKWVDNNGNYLDAISGVWYKKNGERIGDKEEIQEAGGLKAVGIEGEHFELAPILEEFRDALIDIILYLGSLADAAIDMITGFLGSTSVVDVFSKIVYFLINVVVILIKYFVAMYPVLQVIIFVLNAVIQVFMALVGSVLFVFDTLKWFAKQLAVGILHMLTSIIGSERQKSLAKKWAADINDAGNREIIADGESVRAAVEAIFVPMNLDKLISKDQSIIDDSQDGFITQSLKKFLGKSADGSDKAGATDKSLSDVQGTYKGKNDDKKAEKERKKLIQQLQKAYKDAISALKDVLNSALDTYKEIHDQNELDFKQGLKSWDDYYAEEAGLRVAEAQAELDAVLARKEYYSSLPYEHAYDAAKESEDIVREENKARDKLKDAVKYQKDVAVMTGKIVEVQNNTETKMRETANKFGQLSALMSKMQEAESQLLDKQAAVSSSIASALSEAKGSADGIAKSMEDASKLSASISNNVRRASIFTPGVTSGAGGGSKTPTSTRVGQSPKRADIEKLGRVESQYFTADGLRQATATAQDRVKIFNQSPINSDYIKVIGNEAVRRGYTNFIDYFMSVADTQSQFRHYMPDGTVFKNNFGGIGLMGIRQKQLDELYDAKPDLKNLNLNPERVMDNVLLGVLYHGMILGDNNWIAKDAAIHSFGQLMGEPMVENVMRKYYNIGTDGDIQQMSYSVGLAKVDAKTLLFSGDSGKVGYVPLIQGEELSNYGIFTDRNAPPYSDIPHSIKVLKDLEEDAKNSNGKLLNLVFTPGSEVVDDNPLLKRAAEIVGESMLGMFKSLLDAQFKDSDHQLEFGADVMVDSKSAIINNKLIDKSGTGNQVDFATYKKLISVMLNSMSFPATILDDGRIQVSLSSEYLLDKKYANNVADMNSFRALEGKDDEIINTVAHAFTSIVPMFKGQYLDALISEYGVNIDLAREEASRIRAELVNIGGSLDNIDKNTSTTAKQVSKYDNKDASERYLQDDELADKWFYSKLSKEQYDEFSKDMYGQWFDEASGETRPNYAAQVDVAHYRKFGKRLGNADFGNGLTPDKIKKINAFLIAYYWLSSIKENAPSGSLLVPYKNQDPDSNFVRFSTTGFNPDLTTYDETTQGVTLQYNTQDLELIREAAKVAGVPGYFQNAKTFNLVLNDDISLGKRSYRGFNPELIASASLGEDSIMSHWENESAPGFNELGGIFTKIKSIYKDSLTLQRIMYEDQNEITLKDFTGTPNIAKKTYETHDPVGKPDELLNSAKYANDDFERWLGNNLDLLWTNGNVDANGLAKNLYRGVNGKASTDLKGHMTPLIVYLANLVMEGIGEETKDRLGKTYLPVFDSFGESGREFYISRKVVNANDDDDTFDLWDYYLSEEDRGNTLLGNIHAVLPVSIDTATKDGKIHVAIDDESGFIEKYKDDIINSAQIQELQNKGAGVDSDKFVVSYPYLKGVHDDKIKQYNKAETEAIIERFKKDLQKATTGESESKISVVANTSMPVDNWKLLQDAKNDNTIDWEMVRKNINEALANVKTVEQFMYEGWDKEIFGVVMESKDGLELLIQYLDQIIELINAMIESQPLDADVTQLLVWLSRLKGYKIEFESNSKKFSNDQKDVLKKTEENKTRDTLRKRYEAGFESAKTANDLWQAFAYEEAYLGNGNDEGSWDKVFKRYADYYYSDKNRKKNTNSPAYWIDKLQRLALEYEQGGFIAEANDIRAKIREFYESLNNAFKEYLDKLEDYFSNYNEWLSNTWTTSLKKERGEREIQAREGEVKANAYENVLKYYRGLNLTEERNKLKAEAKHEKNPEKLKSLEARIQETYDLEKANRGIIGKWKDQRDEINKELLEMKYVDRSIGEGGLSHPDVVDKKISALINKRVELDKQIHDSEMFVKETEAAKLLATQLAQVNNYLLRTQQVSKQALEDGLVTFLTDGVNEAENLGEALRDLAVSYLKTMQEYFAKEMVTDMMTKWFPVRREEYGEGLLGKNDQFSMMLGYDAMFKDGSLDSRYAVNVPEGITRYSDTDLQAIQYFELNHRDDKWAEYVSKLPEDQRLAVEKAQGTKELSMAGVSRVNQLINTTEQNRDLLIDIRDHLQQIAESLNSGDSSNEPPKTDTAEAVSDSIQKDLETGTEKAVDKVEEKAADNVTNSFDFAWKPDYDLGTSKDIKGDDYFASLTKGAVTDYASQIKMDNIENGVTDINKTTTSIGETTTAIQAAEEASVDTGTTNKASASIEPVVYYGQQGGMITPNGTGIQKIDMEGKGMYSGMSNVFGSNILQTLGSVFAIKTLFTGDTKERLLSAIYLELQLIYTQLVMQGGIFKALAGVGGGSTPKLSMIAKGGVIHAAEGYTPTVQGGIIHGPGTSTSDSIPAMLSDGEAVLNAKAVRQLGVNFVNSVNNGNFARIRAKVPHFASGGVLGDAEQMTARGMQNFGSTVGSNVAVNNNMNIALVRDEQEAMAQFMRSPQGQRIMVDFQRGNGRVFSRFN